jgi:hypothetical protein
VLMKHADLVEHIKSQRIRWIGHIVRMDQERMVKIITERRPVVARRICKPRLRWEDVREDLSEMKIQNWSEMTMDKEAWRIIAERQKSQRVVVPKGEEEFLECNFHLICHSHISVVSDML